MDNKFTEAYQVNVSKYTQTKQNLTYLSWASAWREMMAIYPEATYEIVKDANGKCYFGDGQIGYMVYTKVTANGITHEMWLPVMNHSNISMKDDEYKVNSRTVSAMSSFDVNKTIMRCLTKNLAMFGLGLYIYEGEDIPIVEKKKVALKLDDICDYGKYKGKPDTWRDIMTVDMNFISIISKFEVEKNGTNRINDLVVQYKKEKKND